MKKTIGILAHVDAGKTTFAEQLLYNTGVIRNLGRVDYKNSHMDTDEIEQNRGITIFAGQGKFVYKEDTYYMIDTPGHVDFSAETERVISAMDYAIVIINGSARVQSHTATLFRLLESYGVPAFIFVNKSDMDSFDMELVMDSISDKLTNDAIIINNIEEIKKGNNELTEFAAERDEKFLERYLEDEYKSEDIILSLIRLIKDRRCFPVLYGSALKGIGIDSFLEVFNNLTVTNYSEKGEFVGEVYKIRHDDKGNRLTFVKAIGGKLKVKDEFYFNDSKEKVNEIRIYNGNKYDSVNEVYGGDVFAVTGLKTPVCGSKIVMNGINEGMGKKYYLSSALESRVYITDNTDISTCIQMLRILEQEEPMLSVSYREDTGDILVSVMGKIQLEVLEQIFEKRFGIKIGFEKPKVQYKETIKDTVVGYGHFEPLRHYAEVQLRLEPLNRNSGIEFASECHVDTLGVNYQNLIQTHIFEKMHRGIMTGHPITDIKIVLQDGRAHIKHTEGGDFREATYRAIRQGLEKAESILLEPFYKFEIYVDNRYIGRVMSDIQKMRGTFKSPVQNGSTVMISGRGPVETFMEYGMELVSFTKGTGNISLMIDGYDICEVADKVIGEIGYDKGADKINTSCSIFCAKGTSFVVNWDEAEEYMHTKKQGS